MNSAISVGSIMGDVNRNLLHAVLEGSYADNSSFSAVNRTFDRANFDKMKVVYNACMNEDAIKARGVTPLRTLLDDFEKIYPLNGKGDAKGSNTELTNTLVWLSKHGVSGLVSVDTGVSFDILTLFLRFVTVERRMTNLRIPLFSPLAEDKSNCPSSITTSQ
jgi:Peptidase family M13